jgi:hypothetical protein
VICLLNRCGTRPVYFEVPVRECNTVVGDVDEFTFVVKALCKEKFSNSATIIGNDEVMTKEIS